MEKRTYQSTDEEGPAKSAESITIDVLSQHTGLHGVVGSVDDGHTSDGMMRFKPNQKQRRRHCGKAETSGDGEGRCKEAAQEAERDKQVDFTTPPANLGVQTPLSLCGRVNGFWW